MILSITKHFFIVICSFYLYRKILGFPKPAILEQFLEIVLAFIFATINNYFVINAPSISIIFPILSIYFSLSLRSHISAKLSFIATIISYSFSYATFSTTSIPIIIFLYYLQFDKNQFSYILVIIISGILTYIILHIPFLLKRFKKGMTFLYSDMFLNLGTFISAIIIMCITFIKLREFPGDIVVSLQLLTFFLLGFLLLFWWKNQITKSYIEKLRKIELESLRQEIIEKDTEIQNLIENNDSLARIIHRDNKLIPAMENAVCKFLTDSALLSEEEFHAKGEALTRELRELSASRAGILTEYQAKGQHIPITGVCSVDALFSYMQEKASSFQIAFKINVSTDLVSFTENVISHDDLSHLLSDLIENAIIATKNSAIRKIQLHIGFLADQPVIEISDTGEPFALEILQSFGVEQQTTHADEGGSGIGLMDIWKLKKKYRASLLIQEFDSDPDTFRKKISLTFDSKNHYLIQTYRAQELLMTLKRSDLYVLKNHDT